MLISALEAASKPVEALPPAPLLGAPGLIGDAPHISQARASPSPEACTPIGLEPPVLLPPLCITHTCRRVRLVSPRSSCTPLRVKGRPQQARPRRPGAQRLQPRFGDQLQKLFRKHHSTRWSVSAKWKLTIRGKATVQKERGQRSNDDSSSLCLRSGCICLFVFYLFI